MTKNNNKNMKKEKSKMLNVVSCDKARSVVF